MRLLPSLPPELPSRGDVLEAEIRRRMAKLTPARGFDTAKTRAAEIASIDALLDEYNRVC